MALARGGAPWPGPCGWEGRACAAGSVASRGIHEARATPRVMRAGFFPRQAAKGAAFSRRGRRRVRQEPGTQEPVACGPGSHVGDGLPTWCRVLRMARVSTRGILVANKARGTKRDTGRAAGPRAASTGVARAMAGLRLEALFEGGVVPDNPSPIRSAAQHAAGVSRNVRVLVTR